eukprot:948497-Prymnesium_polylepis.1
MAPRAAPSLMSQCVRSSALQSRAAEPSARRGGAARRKSSRREQAGHAAGGRSAPGSGGGVGRAGGAPLRSHALRKGMRVPQ